MTFPHPPSNPLYTLCLLLSSGICYSTDRTSCCCRGTVCARDKDSGSARLHGGAGGGDVKYQIKREGQTAA